MFRRWGVASWLGAMHAACGVYMGEPIRLFPEKKHGDAGVVAEKDRCIVVRTKVSGNIETLASGATGAELTDLALADYSQQVIWANGDKTRVHVKLSNISVYSVSEQPNTLYDRWSESEVCSDHATIEAAVDLTTEDGKLAEHLDLVLFEAFDDFEAHGSFTIAKGALKGSYQGIARNQQCFMDLNVRLLIARDGTHGSFGDDLKQGTCEDTSDRPIEEYASAHWGERWTNYGD